MDIEGIRYRARVEEVHSGDDLLLMVDLGVDGLFKKVRARLHGVDTPDGYKVGPDTEAGRLRDEVRRLTHGECFVYVVSQGRGGWVVTMYYRDHNADKLASLNEHLRTRGYVFTPNK